MSTVCPPTVFDACTVTVLREKPGSYALEEHHHHEGEQSWCPLSDRYGGLTWDEAMDLAATLMDARRPGMVPAGWEQLQLDVD